MQKELTFQFKARYFSSGAVTPTTKHIWFVLHGYGQLAEYFIRKFDFRDFTCRMLPPETKQVILKLEPPG
jgi:hypothetical protein